MKYIALFIIAIFFTLVLCAVSVVSSYVVLTYGYNAEVKSWPVIICVSAFTFFLTVGLRVSEEIIKKAVAE